MNSRNAIYLALVLVWAPAAASGNVRLPAVFSDNMVLQRDRPLPVWGWAEPGERVTVSLGQQRVEATTNASGKWAATLGATPASAAPQDLTVAGQNTITVHNVLIGDVWLASGQSNMNWPVIGAQNATQEIAQADYPAIRQFAVKWATAPRPQADCQGSWAVCTPRTAGSFSALAYFFVRELYTSTKVPMGILLASYWGGTRAEGWTDEETLLANPLLKGIADAKNRTFAAYANAAYEKMKPWLAEAEAAKAAGRPLPLPPALPPDLRNSQATPTALYNAEIAPLVPYALQGAIWYQGESNSGEAGVYRTLFPAMIQGWRRLWGQGDFPFLFVQLPCTGDPSLEPRDTGWAQLREAQLMTLALPNTGMAVTVDLGEADEVNPKNKQEPGRRLALWAKRMVYGQDTVVSGPLYESMTVEGDAIRLHFAHAEGGLAAKGEALKGFALAGADGRFVWAEAKIEGESVLVRSDKVAAPVAVRYAWDDAPVGNLYNGAGLPASPFRTDRPKLGQ